MSSDNVTGGGASRSLDPGITAACPHTPPLAEAPSGSCTTQTVEGPSLWMALHFLSAFLTRDPWPLQVSATVLIMVCHLTKMAHFVPCHKEITIQESVDLFKSNCYRLLGVLKVVVSDSDPKFVGKFLQRCMGKLNTKLNTSTARNPRTDGLTERVNQIMQTLLRYCCA
jgi:hypothetical protein